MTSREPEQLVLDLPHRQALGAEDFLVSSSNRASVDLVDSWPAWSHPAAIVAGPERSGKSHLVHVWQLRSKAEIVSAASISDASVALFERVPALAVEDIDRGIADERVLFHLLNLAREKKRSILLTSRALPGEIRRYAARFALASQGRAFGRDRSRRRGTPQGRAR